VISYSHFRIHLSSTLGNLLRKLLIWRTRLLIVRTPNPRVPDSSSIPILALTSKATGFTLTWRRHLIRVNAALAMELRFWRLCSLSTQPMTISVASNRCHVVPWLVHDCIMAKSVVSHWCHIVTWMMYQILNDVSNSTTVTNALIHRFHYSKFLANLYWK